MNRQGLRLVLWLLLAAWLAAGCGSTTTGTVVTSAAPVTPSAPAPASAAIGQDIRLTASGSAQTVTLESVRYSRHPASEFGERPRHGQYAIANVLIMCEQGTCEFNLLYFKYQAADGTTFSPADGNAAMAGFDPSLSSGSLSAGQRTRGLVVFDVPKGGGGVLQVTGPAGEVAGQWTL